MVALVGAGPGDEGLLTLRAAKLLGEADLVVYDHLVSADVLRHAAETSVKIFVGKSPGDHTFSQAEISRLLIQEAKNGKKVVRLKGGDPFIFGRGGEEALALAAEGIAFEVVPGVTTGVAAAAYAGIPVTHRTIASSVAFITGHESPERTESAIDWAKISTGVSTLVFYMGMSNLAFIASRLIENGRAASTPAAVIQWGTYGRQRTLTAPLKDIAQEAQRQGFGPPSIILVGDVVSLRQKLRWFDTRPLFGKRIAVAGSAAEASVLCRRLREFGAETFELSTIDFAPLPDLELLDRALETIRSYAWLIFASARSVETFFQRLFLKGYDCRRLAGVKIAVIAQETAESLLRRGITPDLVPADFTSEGVVEAFGAHEDEIRRSKVLIPGSKLACGVIAQWLMEKGAEVTALPLSDNSAPDYRQGVLESLFDKEPDLVTFTSSLTVANFVAIARHSGLAERLKKVRGASIGPATSATAQELGLRIVIEARNRTVEGLVDAIVGYFRQDGRRGESSPSG